MTTRARARFRLPAAGGIAVLAAASLLLAACGSSSGSSAPGGSGGSGGSLVVYDGQHEDTGAALIEAFEAKTGIHVSARAGESSELANQIVEEGSASPADVFYSEESGPMLLLSEKKRLATLPDAALAPIPAQYRSPTGDWVGVSARARVVVYNPSKLTPADMPSSVLGFADPKWKGRIGIVPTSGSFQEQIEAVVALDGKDAALQWLRGLKANAQIYKSNSDALDAVNRGQVDAALINHYYWFGEVREEGASAVPSRLFYFKDGSAGALVNVSPIGIVSSGKHRSQAEQFVEFATSTEGQQVIARASAEYPLNPQVQPAFALVPFAELKPPALSPAQLGDGTQATALLQDVGLL